VHPRTFHYNCNHARAGFPANQPNKYKTCRVGLTQLIRFLVLKLIHPGLNLRFNMGAIFTVNYFLVEDDIPVDSETLLMTDFVNLKIKST
jgi:hypothetical protein